MSRENVELVRSAFEAWGMGDMPRVISAFAPAIEWQTAEDEPDGRTLHGQQEVRDMLSGWVESFAQFTANPQEFIDAGEHVIVPISFIARPHGADRSVTLDETQVYTIEAGAVVSVREYRTKAEALEAVGLSQ